MVVVVVFFFSCELAGNHYVGDTPPSHQTDFAQNKPMKVLQPPNSSAVTSLHRQS